MEDYTNVKVESILKVTEVLEAEKRDYLNRLFSNAPLWLIQSMNIRKYDKDKVFIFEDEPVDFVYILYDGIVRAVDHRIFGMEYDYIRFQGIKIFGSMEILLDIDAYRTTLSTVTPCSLFVMKKEDFRRWIEKDINALLMETKSMGTYMLEQSRKERIFLFLNGMDRLMIIFMEYYDNHQDSSGKAVLKLTRQELSDVSGMSVKTINRSVKKMEEEQFIGRDGNKIIVTKKQYNEMKDYINLMIAEDEK